MFILQYRYMPTSLTTNMHPVGKVFMGVGVLVILGGVVLMVIGGENIDDSGEWNPVEKSDFSGSSGMSSYSYDGEDMIIMVRDNVRCDEFTITMSNSTDTIDLKDACEDNGKVPVGWEDDPSGWYHMASISSWDFNEGEYTIEANNDYEVVPLWTILGEELGEAVGGFFQGAAGFMGICCGVGVFGFGLILGLLVNNNEQKVIVQNTGMPMNNMMMQQPNQTMMTQPVYQKNYADVPVEPQTTIQQPQNEGFWNQEEPKNPF